MNITEFVEMLCKEIERLGSQKKAAQEWGISTQYLNDVIRHRREPGRKILDEFGMYKLVTYEMKDTSGIGFAKEPDFLSVPRTTSSPYSVGVRDQVIMQGESDKPGEDE